MKPVSAKEMRRLDRAAIEEFHIAGRTLMENAGRGVSEVILRTYNPCRVLVFVGKGNNGGDGLVVARLLKQSGFSPQVLMLEDPSNLKADPLANYRRAEELKIPLLVVSANFSEKALAGYCSETELIVDALFGVGLKSDLRGIFLAAVKAINASGRPVISIDIPSGLDADLGVIRGAAVKATVTATLGLPKIGLQQGSAPEHTGKVEVVDIGMPPELLAPFVD